MESQEFSYGGYHKMCKLTLDEAFILYVNRTVQITQVNYLNHLQVT
jgi:hypothetical protein